MGHIISIIYSISILSGMDPYLVAAIVQQESNFKPNAVGALGEVGLMQLRPNLHKVKNQDMLFCDPVQKAPLSTGRYSWCDGILFSPEYNISTGVNYLIDIKKRCRFKKNNAYIVCYNAGVAGAKNYTSPRKSKYYNGVMQKYENLKNQNIFEAQGVAYAH